MLEKWKENKTGFLNNIKMEDIIKFSKEDVRNFWKISWISDLSGKKLHFYENPLKNPIILSDFAKSKELQILIDQESVIARNLRTNFKEGLIKSLFRVYKQEVKEIQRLNPQNNMQEDLVQSVKDLFEERNRMYNPKTREGYLREYFTD